MPEPGFIDRYARLGALVALPFTALAQPEAISPASCCVAVPSRQVSRF